MQRAAHEPCLDQRFLLPQRLADVVDVAVDAGGDLELGCGHELGLGAADLADHLSELLLWRAAREVMALEPKGVDLRPAELGCDRLSRRARHRAGRTGPGGGPCRRAGSARR